MEVIVAGYTKTAEDNLSPEIISAAYARTSRDPRSIPEIREDAKTYVAGCQESNKKIVFEMGHASIAEHVVFNIDIIGVSRFLVEEIESHRLASYTEKSQRYVLFNAEYVIPEELENGSNAKQEFYRITNRQFKAYEDFYPILFNYFKDKYPKTHKENLKLLEGWAKEDARYIIPLATKTQLGMTINARNLELMIRRLRACPFEEHRHLAQKLYNAVVKIAPSLFPYTKPSEVEMFCKELSLKTSNPHFQIKETCSLVNYPVFANMKTQNSEYLNNKLFKLFNKEDINELFNKMEVYDTVPREFECVDFEFIAKISASCYAQLKRHRMMTLIPYNYFPTEDVVIPESIIKSKLKYKFLDIVEDTNSFHNLNSHIFPYIATNSHIRNVYIKINLREFYHFCRMRMDMHAQWEIRQLATQMYNLALEYCCNGLELACGKDEFKNFSVWRKERAQQ